MTQEQQTGYRDIDVESADKRGKLFDRLLADLRFGVQQGDVWDMV